MKTTVMFYQVTTKRSWLFRHKYTYINEQGALRAAESWSDGYEHPFRVWAVHNVRPLRRSLIKIVYPKVKSK